MEKCRKFPILYQLAVVYLVIPTILAQLEGVLSYPIKVLGTRGANSGSIVARGSTLLEESQDVMGNHLNFFRNR